MQQSMDNELKKNNIFYDFCLQFNIQNIEQSNLFLEAMTHSSVGKKKNYERMEFLGDTLLNFCISRMLFEQKQNAKEGELSKEKSFLCSRSTCLIVAKEIGLEAKIRTAKKQNIDLNNILADVLESFLCLVYYEYGIEKVHEIVEFLFSKYINSKQALDPKMHLQEIAQKKYQQLPEYSLLSKEGSDNQPIFKVSVSCGDLYSEGIGKSKKNAEKQAAENLLSLINKKK